MRIIALNILVLVCLFHPATARAQLFLEDGKVTLAVAGGEHLDKSLTIANTSAETVHVRIYWEDFKYQAPFDGTKKFFPAGVGENSVSKWISFSPQEITLPAYGKQKIDYSVSVPGQFESGAYGVLFFERTGANLKDASGLDIITRVGCLFFVEPKDILRQASIEKVTVKGQNLSGDFVNTSKIVLLPRMVYYIMEEGGMVKDRGELKTLYVPVEGTASWELPLPKDLKTGHYSIVLNVDLGNENVVTKELSLTKDVSGQLTIDKAST
ncbi:MAG: hypothetical protein HQL15_09550 [Candidatus Omnitrophica bacterium]|nr:hypothetical protein [Candidatus Omnitrophota bacterium]